MRRAPLSWALGGLLALTVAAWFAAARWPVTAGSARAGVAASALASLGSLGLKRRALSRGLAFALLTVTGTFFARLLLLIAGVAVAKAQTGSPAAFALGFLAIFGVWLWVELGYLAAAAREVKR